MDPFTHTMTGAVLAQTGLGKRSRYGAAALVIGANLPDIDAFTQFLGMDTALYIRRGWTHGLLALVVLPLLLTGVLSLIGRRRRSSGPPPVPGTLFSLAFLSFAVHLPMDWLNTYGVRWLMPFDGRWFYGDAVFIMDPWIWLVLGGAVFLRHSNTLKSKVIWAVVACLATTLVFLAAPAGLLPAKVLWLAGLGLVIALRFRTLLAEDLRARRFALAALALTTLYIGCLIGLASYARSFVEKEATKQGLSPMRVMAGPVPLTLLTRDVLVETPDAYRYGILKLWPQPRLELEPRVIPRPQKESLARRALQSPSIQGFMNWARFPYVEIEENENGVTVYVLDARYTRERTAGFGGAKVVLAGGELGSGR
jgi:inner membrane protein